MTFQELQLIEPLLKALSQEGYSNPTPIQAQAIPSILQKRDLLGCAQTGTGKTAAFAIPILQLLYNERLTQPKGAGIRALILTPTRELAIQIADSFTAYGRHTRLRNLVIFGGVSQVPQEKSLRQGTEILIATPGRLLDLMNQKLVNLQQISLFVLDEADRMLDMGFIHDVKKVIAQLPKERQNLLFSATMPPEIAGLADNILVDPVKVAVTPVSSTAELIEQLVYFVDKNKKRYLLLDLLKDPAITSALVFTRTKHGANRVAGDLSKAGIRAEAIHGNKSQTARQNALNNFKNKKTRVLVATDIAARGIDLEELSHVINYELPNVPETYVHRIGRTGRAGASGIAFSFCDQEEMPFLRDIQRLIGKKVPVAHNDTFDLNIPAPDVPLPAAERPARPQHQQGRQKQQPNQQQPRKGNQRQQNRAGKAGQEQAQGDQRQQKRQGQENPSKTQQQTQPHHLPKPKNMSPKPHHKHQPDKPQPDQKAYDSRHSDRSAQNRRQPSGQSRQPDNRGREQQPNRRPQQEEKYSENQGVETAPKKEQQPVAAKSSVFQKPSDPNAKKGFVIRTEPSPTWKKKPSAQNFRGKFNQKKGR